MAVYFFAYDLTKKKPEFDYEILWDELKRLKAHRTQLSAWLINLNNTPTEVINHFKSFVHPDDRLWAVRLMKSNGVDQWSYVNAMAGTNDWLAKNPPT